jgi:hypothetical protein
MVQHSATRCSCIAIFLISLMSFVAITICVASQRVFVVVVVVYLVMIQSKNFLIHPRIYLYWHVQSLKVQNRFRLNLVLLVITAKCVQDK